MGIKIKSILQDSDPNGVLTTSWLEKHNVTRAEQTQYVRSGWLVRIVPGIYHLANVKPTLRKISIGDMEAAQSCQTKKGKPCKTAK